MILAVVADIVKLSKTIMLELKTVGYCQGNAGCYHCGSTIVCTSLLGNKLEVALKGMDFSNPQGGKGACDCKAALIVPRMLELRQEYGDTRRDGRSYSLFSWDGISQCHPLQVRHKKP